MTPVFVLKGGGHTVSALQFHTTAGADLCQLPQVPIYLIPVERDPGDVLTLAPGHLTNWKYRERNSKQAYRSMFPFVLRKF